VVQENFGVNSHVRTVADGFAAAGYFSVAPALFDRVERGVELGYESQDMQRVPVQAHFGERDAHIPLAGDEAFAKAQPGASVQLYATGDDFNCDQRASFDAATAALARGRTLAFLRQHVG